MKKYILLFGCFFPVLFIAAQKNLSLSLAKLEKTILEDGKKLYQMEKTSTMGVTIYKRDMAGLYANTAGYFPYKDGPFYKCVFYNKMADAQILATISFDSTFNINRIAVNTTLRPMTWLEKDLYMMNQHALDDIKRDTTFYKFFSNTSTSILPIVEPDRRSIYVLTKSDDPSVVVFGNDYQIDFDNANYISSRKLLHSELITIEPASTDPYVDEIPENVMHKHDAGASDFMTPTDVCILLLNQKANRWKHHVVIGQNYVSVWYCDVSELQAVTKKEWYKYNKPEKATAEKEKPVAVVNK